MSRVYSLSRWPLIQDEEGTALEWIKASHKIWSSALTNGQHKHQAQALLGGRPAATTGAAASSAANLLPLKCLPQPEDMAATERLAKLAHKMQARDGRRTDRVLTEDNANARGRRLPSGGKLPTWDFFFSFLMATFDK